ncbi:MAG: discoidin domain-containing protein, partial [Muribaculaceae bacterium]|nr:discoidin domain-containing protein [Muribaculaceae bacterium]
MKKALLFLFAAAMALTSAAQTNLAVGKTSIATSGTNVASGNDGDEGTRWESEHGVDPQSWQVDLGESTTINAVRIVWEPAYAKSFDIIVGDEVDADGYVTNGTTVLSVVDQVLPSNNNVQVFTFTAVQARYVMFHGLARATSYGYSFWEFGVYDLTDPLVLSSMTLSAASNQTILGTPVALTLLGKDQLGATIATGDVTYVLSDPTVGSVVDGQFVPAAAGTTTIKAVAGTVESNEVAMTVNAGAKIDLFTGWDTRVYNLGLATSDSKVGAFDSNDGSVWAMLGRETGADEASRTYDVGFIADLRGIYDITNISIHFEGACSENFTLSFAGADGVFGDAVYTGGATGVNNHTETFSGQPVTDVRYVKFFSTKASTQWDVKIFDFSVYGALKSAIADVVAPTVSATAGEATDESITLNITGNDNTSKYLAYEVTVDEGAAKVYALGTNVAGEAAPVTITNLNGGTEYTFKIVAIDGVGNRSEATTLTASTVGDVFTLTSAPAPTHDAENVKSIFSDTYTPATTFNPGTWSQATVLSYVTVGQDNIMYLTNFNYQGLEYVPDTGFSIA